MRLQFDGFEIDLEDCRLSRAGVEVQLEPRALDLLCYLASRPGRLIRHQELLREVWRVHSLSAGVLASTVAKLRKALGQTAPARTPIETVHGRGYRWNAVAVREFARARADSHLPLAAALDPFVGREDALARLTATLQQAAASQGQFVLITGEAGIGKTRTLRELSELARRHGFHVWEGDAREHNAAPAYWPWVEVLRAAHEDLAAANWRQHVPTDAWALGLLVPELWSRSAPASDLEAPSARFRLFDEISRFIASASAQAPVLIALEDLHCADLGTLELLLHVAGGLRKRPLLVAATSRDGEPDNPADAQAERRSSTLRRLERHALRIALEGLSVDAVLQWMVELKLAARFERRSSAMSICELSQGNPLFVREILQLWAARGQGPESALSEPMTALRMPPALHDLLQQRYAGLDPSGLRVLRTCAAIGGEFDTPLIGSALELGPDHVLRALQLARNRGLIERVATAPDCFRFTHALLRNALYEQLDLASAGALHAKLEQLLLVRPGSPDPLRLAEIARHALLANPVQLETCVAHCTRAAEAAREASGFEAAADLVTRALCKLETHGHSREHEHMRADLLLTLGIDLFCADDAARALRTLHEGALLARRLGAAATFARFACELATWSRVAGGAEAQARQTVEDALALLDETASDQRALLLGHLADLGVELAFEERLQLLARAATLAQHERTPAVLVELANVRVRLRHPTQLEDNRAAVTRFRVLAKQHPDALRAPYRMLWRFDADFADYYGALAAGDLTSADGIARRCRATAQELGSAGLQLVADAMAAGRALGDARFDDLEQQLELMRGRTATGAFGPLITGYFTLRSCEARGNFAALSGGFVDPLALSAVWGRAARIAQVWLAWTLVKTAQYEQARLLLSVLRSNAGPELAAMPSNYGDLGVACMLAEIYCELSDVAGAQTCYRQLAPFAELNAVGPCTDYFGCVAHFLGLLACMFGESAQALVYCSTAERHNSRLGMPLQIERTRSLRARCLRSQHAT